MENQQIFWDFVKACNFMKDGDYDRCKEELYQNYDLEQRKKIREMCKHLEEKLERKLAALGWHADDDRMDFIGNVLAKGEEYVSHVLSDQFNKESVDAALADGDWYEGGMSYIVLPKEKMRWEILE